MCYYLNKLNTFWINELIVIEAKQHHTELYKHLLVICELLFELYYV